MSFGSTLASSCLQTGVAKASLKSSLETLKKAIICFQKDGLKASGWSESVFNVFCRGVITDTKSYLPYSCLPATVETANSNNSKSPKPAGRMMPWFTPLVSTLLMRSDSRFAILSLAHYLSPHKWTPGQMSCNVGQ